LDLSNSRPTNFCCQLLRCLVCTVSWCTRSVHAMNDRENTAMYTAVFGSWTDHVHGPCTAVYTVCTWPWTAVYMGRKHDRVYGRIPVHGRVYGPCTGPPMYRYMTRAVYRLCTRSCTGHVHGPSMTRTRPCTAVHSVHGRVNGPCTQPCTDREHGR